MPHIVTAESEMGKEQAKWEMFPVRGITGDWTPGNPFVKGNTNKPSTANGMVGHGAAGAEYPKMLYRAATRQDGSTGCMDGVPHPLSFPNAEAHDRAAQVVEHFNTKCCLIVNSEVEESRAMESGWRLTVDAALEHAKKRDTDMLKAAAHRAYEDRNMSPAAQAEAARAEAEAGIKQLGEIPRKPVRRSQASINKAKATRAANKARAEPAPAA